MESSKDFSFHKEIYVQFLQLSDYDKIRIQQCKMEVGRIFYCGMHLRILAVQNGRNLQSLSNTAYQLLRETGTLSLGGSAIISGASPNSTVTSSISRINYNGWNVLEYNIAIHMELGIWWLCKLPLKSSSKTSKVHHHNLFFFAPCDVRRMPRLGEWRNLLASGTTE